MRDLISESPQARNWVDKLESESKNNGNFGAYVAGVGWIGETGPDGEPIGGSDPSYIVEEINSHGWPLIDNHDPGKPVGRVIRAKLCETADGKRFVAIYCGLYDEKTALRFDTFGLDVSTNPPDPETLPEPHESWRIELMYDPREIEESWIASLNKEETANLRVPLKVTHLSHNADDTVIELLRVALPFAVLAWNPFVTEIAKEAAKDTYAGIKAWLNALVNRLRERKNPVVCIQSNIADVETIFFLRGSDIGINRLANEALPAAAKKAKHLIVQLQNMKMNPDAAAFEYDSEHGWYPSYVLLEDGRIIADRNVLLALEPERSGLSLGISVKRGANKPLKDVAPKYERGPHK